MFDNILNAFEETLDAIKANNDRLIGIFAVPLIIMLFATAAQFTILVNQSHTTILSALISSGVCNTYQPYLITSILGTFQGNPYVHVAMCQVASFNIFVSIGWYLEILTIIFFTVFIFEAITHLG